MNDVNKLPPRKPRALFVGAPFFVPPSAADFHTQFTATGRNTGNLLIGDAVARFLDVDVQMGSIVREPALRESTDLIVIPSANFLSPVMDISWLEPTIDATNKPILMVGVGAQFPTTSVRKAVLPETTVRLMRKIADRSKTIGVRGEFTADVLRKYGIRNVRVIGCPSLFRLGKPSLTIKKYSTTAVKPMLNGSSNVLGHAYSVEYARGAELKLLKLAMEYDAPYIFQNELPEMLAASGASESEYVAGCKGTLANLQADIPFDDYLQYVKRQGKMFFDVEQWATFAAEHDLVVGTRFHGNMIAISQGIPATIIAHDSRTSELCDALKIPYMGLKTFLKLRPSQIFEPADFSKFERNYPVARKNLVDFFTENGVPHRLGEDSENMIFKAFKAISERFGAPKPAPAKPALAPVAAPAAIRPPELPIVIQSAPPVVVTKPLAGDPVERMKEHLQANDLEAALESYKETPETHPKFIGAGQLLASSLLFSKPSMAMNLALEAIETRPEDPKGPWMYARALYRLDKPDEARAVLQEAIERFENHPWKVELVKLLAQINDN